MAPIIQIIIDNLTEGICYAGQTLTGRVECNFGSEKKLRAVKIKFKGECDTSWNQSGREYDTFRKAYQTKTVRYRADEVYFSHEQVLVGGGSEFKLRAGKYTYPFSYMLPQLLPSSYQNELGKVQYTVKATVDCPWRFNDEAKAILKLIAPLDLNYFPHLKQPTEAAVDKTLFTWSFSGNSDPLTFKMFVPITAYASGQQVKINAFVENMTNVNVENVHFKITQSIEFITHYPTTSKRHVENVVISCTESGVGAHSEKRWTPVLTIPTGKPILNMVHCKLINIAYHLHGEVVIPFPHTNLCASIPLMIGNLPLTDLNTGRPIIDTNVNYHPSPSAPILTQPGHLYPQLYADTASAPPLPQAPPTYEEAQRQVGKPCSNGANTKAGLKDDDFELI